MIDTHPRLFRLVCVLVMLIGLLCAWLFPFPLGAQGAPPFTARWDAPGRATLRWEQSSHTCLYRESAIGERAYIGCFDGSGDAVLTLGGPQTDGTKRPTVGDVFVLDGPEGVRRARLAGVVYVGVVRR